MHRAHTVLQTLLKSEPYALSDKFVAKAHPVSNLQKILQSRLKGQYREVESLVDLIDFGACFKTRLLWARAPYRFDLWVSYY
jgi:hypothetical protein